jgi:hypothetical protein
MPVAMMPMPVTMRMPVTMPMPAAPVHLLDDAFPSLLRCSRQSLRHRRRSGYRSHERRRRDDGRAQCQLDEHLLSHSVFGSALPRSIIYGPRAKFPSQHLSSPRVFAASIVGHLRHSNEGGEDAGRDPEAGPDDPG